MMKEKITATTKKEAIRYLINRSTKRHDIPLKEILAVENVLTRAINTSERVLGNGHAVLSHSNENIISKAAKHGIELPKFFSIVLSTDSFLVSDSFGDPLHSVK